MSPRNRPWKFLRADGTLPPIAGADPVTDEKPVLVQLHDRRTALLDEIQPLLDEREAVRTAFEERRSAEAEADQPTAEERTQFAADEEQFNEWLSGLMSDLDSLDARIAQHETVERSREAAQAASVGTGTAVSITHEPHTYRRDNQRQRSYFMDLAAATVPEARALPRSDGYQERLQRHAKEMEEVVTRAKAKRELRAQKALEDGETEIRSRYQLRGGLDESPFHRSRWSETDGLEERAPSRAPGSGGYSVPPLWMVQDLIPGLRPGRVATELCRNVPLPEGTDSINIPKLSTLTKTGIQTADSAPVVSRDFTDTFVQANVKTIAGQEDVPIQLIEQSPGQILDSALMTDLHADYDQQADLQVIQGNGSGGPLSGGQMFGLYPATNWGATGVTWTAASPTVAGFFQVLGAMMSKTAYNRFSLVDFQYLFHPRRAGWWLTGTDTVGRPLVSQLGFNPYNPQALEQSMLPFEGRVADLPFGPAAYMDANVPITDSSGTPGGGTADIALACIWDDIWFFEGDLRTRVLSEVLSGTLELRFQVFNYVALLSRYGPSITIGTGTGFAAPQTVDGTAY